MILNKSVTINNINFKYTIFERKDTKPYVSKSGLTVTTAVLAPFIYSYRTSTKQSNFKFEVKAGIWASEEIFERWLTGDTDKTEPIDTYDIMFSLDGQKLTSQNDNGETVELGTILKLEDAIQWFIPSIEHIGGFEITDVGYGANGILTLPDPLSGLPLNESWN